METKATVATVKFGQLEFEGLMLPDGSFGIGLPQLVNIGFSPSKMATEIARAVASKQTYWHKLLK